MMSERFEGFRFIWRIMAVVAAMFAVGAPLSSGQETAVDEQLDSLSCRSKVMVIDGTPLTQHEIDSLQRIVNMFYYDQFRHSQDPDAPYFLFLSKSSDMMMGIGGTVRMRGWYDWGGAIPANGFAPALIPIPANPAQMRKFGTTAAGVALFLRVIGRNRILGNYQLYVETNFNGYQGHGLKLKKAYAQVRDFTVGLATSTFSDPAAVPPTVDAQGPTNKLAKSSVLLRYMPSFGRFSFGISAETPDASVGADNVATTATSAWLPDGAALVQYEWLPGQHIRLSGIVRSLGYRNLLEEKNINKLGWGVQLSSVARPLSQVTTYFTFNYGKGYGSLANDLMAVVTDLIAEPDRPGYLYAPRSLGYCAGVQYNFLRNLFGTVQFSQTRLLPDSSVAPDTYKYGWCMTVNAFWNPIERLQIGAEFNLGMRKNFSGQHRQARRIGALAQFSF